MNKFEAELRRNDIQLFFKGGVEYCTPKYLFKNFISYQNGSLVINSINNGPAAYNLNSYNKIFVTGAGKASASMAKALEDILSSNIYDGIIVTKYGFLQELKSIKVIEASHPLPDTNSVLASLKILEMINSADENDLVINLISGGASSLLTLPVDGISLDDKIITTKVLLKNEISIHEINTIRKCISKVKGGGLISGTKATVITLIISDVIGDDLNIIGSGPTYPAIPDYNKAFEIIEKYNLIELIPESVINYLKDAALNPNLEKNIIFPNIANYIIGNNDMVLDKIEELAKIKGYSTFKIKNKICGEVRSAARKYFEIISNISDLSKPICIISGGETTVNVIGKGKGGRNQEFCLSLINLIKNEDNLVVLSAGTDGNDGPTDAAGAFIDKLLINDAENRNINYLSFLSDNDSYQFFKNINALVFTGPTLTNLMDVQIAIKV